MNRECDAFVDTLSVSDLTCLEISGQESRWAKRKWAEYKATAFPEYDICSEPLPGAWDVIIAEQVLEHVPDPQRALDNIYTMLRTGGVALITTPFLIKYHAYPHDFYRWTADGMRHTLGRSGFRNIAINSWGNRECLIADMTDDSSWTFYVPRRHTLRDDPRFPLVVWAFAHK
jgi:SAM-dependent methyltransferase